MLRADTATLIMKLPILSDDNRICQGPGVTLKLATQSGACVIAHVGLMLVVSFYLISWFGSLGSKISMF